MADHVLSDVHGDQLAEYLRFLRRKRDTAVAEVAAEFKELKETRLFDDNYAAEDVENMLEGLLSGAAARRGISRPTSLALCSLQPLGSRPLRVQSSART